MAQELVTLNRTLAVQIDGSVRKVSAFTGKYASSSTKEDVSYRIDVIHLPAHYTSLHSVWLSFKRSAIVSSQEVQ